MRKLENLARQIDEHINAQLVATGIGRDRGLDWYLYFLKKGVTSFFGVTACTEHYKIFCNQHGDIHMNGDSCEDTEATHLVEHGFIEEEHIAAGSQSLLQEDKDTESIYTAEDYLEGAVERLTDLGQDSQAQLVLDIYGYDLGKSGDPVSILSTLEEGAERNERS